MSNILVENSSQRERGLHGIFMTTFEYISKSFLDLGTKLSLGQVSWLFISLDRLSSLIPCHCPPYSCLPCPACSLSILRKGIISIFIRIFFIFLLNHAFFVLVELRIPI